MYMYMYIRVVLGKRKCSTKEAKLGILWQGKLGRAREGLREEGGG